MKVLITIAMAAMVASAQEPQKPVSDRDEVRIAIIDTGFDVTHSGDALLARKPDICDQGKDTFNFVDTLKDGSPSSDVTDHHGHGTHIAGIISQRAGNAKFCLIILRYYSTTGSDIENLNRSNAAFKKAIELNADIINYSGGGVARSPAECDLVKQALDKDIVVVAAAGNERSDLTVRKYWPVMCDPRVVAVTATDKFGKVLDTSNYSSNPDQIYVSKEPGKDILSLLPVGQYGYMTGTSQAAASMSGKLANHLYVLRKSEYGRYLIKKGSGWGK